MNSLIIRRGKNISKIFASSVNLSTVSRGGRRRKPPTSTAPVPLPKEPVAIEDAWTEVKDKNTGMIYWWNTVTNETTQLGAPKPNGPTALAPSQQQQSGGVMSGLGQVMAQGFAFGVGSSIAHGVVGSMFGGGHSNDGGGDGGGDSEGFDI